MARESSDIESGSPKRSKISPDSPTLQNVHFSLRDEIIDVVIADEDTLFVEGLAALVNQWEEFEVSGKALTFAGAVKLCQENQPRIAMLAVRINGEHVASVISSIAEVSPNTNVIVLASKRQADYVIDALRAGAWGYGAREEVSPNRIRSLIWGVACEDIAFSGSIREALMNALNASAPSVEQQELDRMDKLTERERRILIYLARGWSNAEIADQLYLSQPTVTKEISNIIEKLQVTNRVQAAVAAVRHPGFKG